VSHRLTVTEYKKNTYNPSKTYTIYSMPFFFAYYSWDEVSPLDFSCNYEIVQLIIRKSQRNRKIVFDRSSPASTTVTVVPNISYLVTSRSIGSYFNAKRFFRLYKQSWRRRTQSDNVDIAVFLALLSIGPTQSVKHSDCSVLRGWGLNSRAVGGGGTHSIMCIERRA
jgi:hypothetical protein